MKLLVVLLVAVASTWAENNFGNECYHCPHFNIQGQGFMEFPNTTQCCYYYECWRVQDATTIQQMKRNCPPGTWWNPKHGEDGIPCIDKKPYDNCVDVCWDMPDPTPTPGCHYYALWSDPNQFGPMVDGGVEPLWKCVPGAVFDNSSCTCCVKPEACFCMMDLTLANDIEDDSCTNGEIFSHGAPVTFSAAAVPDGSAATFTGSAGMSLLNDQVFSGMFSPCDVKCLSVGLFFRANDVTAYQGLISYGACNHDLVPAFEIYVKGGSVWAGIDGDLLAAGVNAGQWYYFSFVYQERTGKFRIYLMSVADAIDCATNCNCPSQISSRTLGDCSIAPRPCGLTVGHTGVDDSSNDFFNGQIARAQVSTKCNMMGCETATCMLRGKRGRKIKYPW